MLSYLLGLAVLRYVLGELLRLAGLGMLAWAGSSALLWGLRSKPHSERLDERWRQLSDEVHR